jgi:hypothetical protein
MKKDKNMIYIIGAAAAAALGYFWLKRKKDAASNLEVIPKDVKIDWKRSKEAFYTKIFYSIKLDLINNETADVNVKNINLNVIGNGSLLGNVINSTGFVVPQVSTKEVIISGSINSSGIISIIMDIIRDGLNISVSVKGYVQTDLGRVMVDSTKNINV